MSDVNPQPHKVATAHRIRAMSGRDPYEEHRVATPLELLFDLTFVIGFGIAASEFAHMLAENHVGAGLLGFSFATFAVCWAWINFKRRITCFRKATPGPRHPESTCRSGYSLTEGTTNGGYGWYEPLVAAFPHLVVHKRAWGSHTSRMLPLTGRRRFWTFRQTSMSWRSARTTSGTKDRASRR